MSPAEQQTGRIVFSDGTIFDWEAEEFLPYDPAAYMNDEGLVVVGVEQPNISYFISTMTGDVYGPEDVDPDETTLTRLIEGAVCPEITQQINDMLASLGVEL